jgi:hypothetical protein
MAGGHVRATSQRLNVKRTGVVPVNPVANTAQAREGTQMLR